MQSTFNITFLIRKARGSKENRTIFVRINIKGKRSEFSTQQSVAEKYWDSNKCFPKSTTLELKKICNHLDRMKYHLSEIYREHIIQNPSLSAKDVKNLFLGNGSSEENYLSDIIIYHEEKSKTTLAPGTLKNYGSTEKYLKKFIKHKYKSDDIKLEDITSKFVFEFEYFLRTYEPLDHRNPLSNNGVMKHMERFKKLINLAIKIDWLEKNPFRNFTPKFDKVEREFLTEVELQKIKEKDFGGQRLEQVRDIFIFSCYTGLSFIDVANLAEENIILGIDGEKWISTHRQKTFSKVFLPLLSEAEAILEKYKDNPRAQHKGILLPAASNQKTNAYLKEIADICGIKKKLTFHIARHTFATTVTLTNGVPIETVSKMLGHTKMATTQIYAKVVENKIGTDMAALKQKLAESQNIRKAD
jgi:site-specific recombinase XerD